MVRVVFYLGHDPGGASSHSIQSHRVIPPSFPTHHAPFPAQTPSPPDACGACAQSGALSTHRRRQHRSSASDGRPGIENTAGLLFRVGARGGLDHGSGRKRRRRWDRGMCRFWGVPVETLGIRNFLAAATMRLSACIAPGGC